MACEMQIQEKYFLGIISMAALIIDYIRHYLGFSWLTGPVLDKELRVSSRKRRNYVLRFAYISLLLMILFLVWISVISYRAPSVFQVSRMAEAGKAIITYIVWFQFCAAQIIAIIMLSNAISDEIYHKTLGMLMTTPITSLQIVMGKLFSKLLQLLLLLAISMPLLAVVRLFGGVPWQFVTTSLLLTVSMVFFVSSLSLFYSIFCRRAYVVIILTVLTLVVLFALIPFIFFTMITLLELYKVIPERTLIYFLYQPNPYITFFINTMIMIEPRSSSSIGFFYGSVYINAGFLFVLSLLLLLLSIISVRKVALRQATGQLLSSRQKEAIKDEKRFYKNKRNSSIISVVGPPILWKELILPLRRHVKIYRIIIVLIFLAILLYSYWYLYKENVISQDYPHVFYAIIFMGLGTLFTIVLSATTITTEKESSAWPLLLTSTLGDWQIVLGKFLGVLSRCFPVWLILLGHVIIFTFTGVLHPVVIPLTLILVTWYIVLLSSSGLFFSSLFKKTTTAVIMNFVFVLSVWGIIPLILGIISAIERSGEIIEGGLFFNPFIQVIVIIISTVKSHSRMNSIRLQFDWPSGLESMGTTLTIFIGSLLMYLIVSLIFLWCAKKRLRRKIF